MGLWCIFNNKELKKYNCRIYGFSYPKYRGGPMFYASQIGLQRVYDRICHYHQTCRELCINYVYKNFNSATKHNFLMVTESKNFVIKKKKQILDHCKKKNGWNNLSSYMCMYTMKWGVGGNEIHVIVQKIYLFHYQHTAYTGFRIHFWRNLRRTMCHLPSGPTMYLRAKCESSYTCQTILYYLHIP